MKNLRTLRRERGLTQQALGEAMGLSQQSINKYETGKTQPDFQMLMSLAEFFHTSIDYLIGYTENPISYRMAADGSSDSETVSSPYKLDKAEPEAAALTQSLRETPAHESTRLLAVTPKECHHLAMYRNLPPQTQTYLDALLEYMEPNHREQDTEPDAGL